MFVSLVDVIGLTSVRSLLAERGCSSSSSLGSSCSIGVVSGGSIIMLSGGFDLIF